MTRYKLQASLNGGEISPLLYGRPDLEKFQTALARCVNFIPIPQGGVTRRPGFRFVARAKTADAPVRLVPFIFSRQQAYILEFGDNYVRFFMNNGQLFSSVATFNLLAESGSVLLTEDGQVFVSEQISPDAEPYEIYSPYSASELQSIQYAQTADVMYITHPNHPPRTLTRFGHTSWEFVEINTKNGPFIGYNVNEAHTIQASGVSGSVTLTSSLPFFDPGHVGALMFLEEQSFDQYSMWEPGKTYAVGVRVRWSGNVYQAQSVGGDSGAVAPVHFEGTRWDGQQSASVLWQYLHSGFGIARVTEYANATSVTATVLRRFPEDVVGQGTRNWKEGAWSTYRGWPRATTLFEQRAWFGGTYHNPQTLWSSVAGDFADYELGDLADDAIDWTINTRTANPILSLVDGANLHVLCQDREMIGRASNNGAAVKPDDFTVRPSTSYGSASVVPVTVDTSLLFVDASGKRVIELSYDVAQDNYAPFDTTIFAEHITRPGG